jgi:hypothetical protein
MFDNTEERREKERKMAPTLSERAQPEYTFQYLNAAGLNARLNALRQTQCASVMEVSSIGKSVQGRDLTVVRMTKDVAKGTNLGRPKFKYGKLSHSFIIIIN